MKIRYKIQTIGMALLLFTTTFCLGCRRYAEVSSRESLDFIKQVYTACNTKNQARLVECERKLEQLHQEGAVGAKERKSFEYIIELGKKQEWEQAQNQSLRFARDQVR